MSLDVNLINPFLKATDNALQMMANCTPQRTNVYIKKDDTLKGDISGVMGVLGDVSGAIAVSFSKEAACKIASGMLGEEHNELNDDVADAIKEVLNLISGQSKAELSGTKYHFKLAIPSCIIGSGHRIVQMKQADCIAVDFELEGHPFCLEIAIKPSSEDS